MQSLEEKLKADLSQDAYLEDVTTSLIPEAHERTTRCYVKCNERGVFSGSSVVRAFQKLGLSLDWTMHLKDGDIIAPGDSLVSLTGTIYSCLSVERTLLNWLGHLCGVATETRRYVDAVKPHPVRILATRKTLPGLRPWQLEAVEAGGGFAHRRSLSDGVLIKENHLYFSTPKELITRARASSSPLHGIEIEVQDLRILDSVLEVKPDVIMLDNFTVPDIETAIRKISGKARVEISGGVTLDKISTLARLGADFISVGALTHSVKNINLSMEYES